MLRSIGPPIHLPDQMGLVIFHYPNIDGIKCITH